MTRTSPYLEHRAALASLGEHWQKLLAYGHGPWRGDRNLVLYHQTLLDQIEVWYELPDQQPTLIFSIPVEQFDINRLCHQLWRADNHNVTIEEKVAEVDANNERILAERDKVAADMKEAATEKLQWAIQRDFHTHPAPVVVPKDLRK